MMFLFWLRLLCPHCLSNTIEHFSRKKPEKKLLIISCSSSRPGRLQLQLERHSLTWDPFSQWTDYRPRRRSNLHRTRVIRTWEVAVEGTVVTCHITTRVTPTLRRRQQTRISSRLRVGFVLDLTRLRLTLLTMIFFFFFFMSPLKVRPREITEAMSMAKVQLQTRWTCQWGMDRRLSTRLKE